MAAPALVALAHGSRDPRSAATIKALVAEVKAMRPDLKIETAFLDLSKPSFDTVVDRLVKAGSRGDRRRPAAAHRGLPRQGRRPGGDRRRHGPPRGRPHPGQPDPRHGGRLPRGARRAPARGAQGGPGARARRAGAGCCRLVRPARQPGGRPDRPHVGRTPQAARRRRPSRRPLRRPPARPCAPSAPRASATSPSASFFLAPGRLPDRAAELAVEAGAVAVVRPARARTPRSPARSWPATPSARSSSSRSDA